MNYLVLLLITGCIVNAYRYPDRNDDGDDGYPALDETVDYADNYDDGPTLMENQEDEENDDNLDAEEEDDIDTYAFKDPFRFRVRVPRIRIPRPRIRIPRPRIRLPRVRNPRIRLPRVRIPRIRLPRVRLPRIRIPRVRIPRIRIRLPRIKLPKIPKINFRLPSIKTIDPNLYELILETLQKLWAKKPTQPPPPPTKPTVITTTIALPVCHQEIVKKVTGKMTCPTNWKTHIGALMELFRPSCIKHNICTSCMGREGWNQTLCDQRLYSDLNASCVLLNTAGGKTYVDWCLDKVYWLDVLLKMRKYPAKSAPFCDDCITPLGNPYDKLDLS